MKKLIYYTLKNARFGIKWLFSHYILRKPILRLLKLFSIETKTNYDQYNLH
jgi:hypothetical protein